MDAFLERYGSAITKETVDQFNRYRASAIMWSRYAWLLRLPRSPCEYCHNELPFEVCVAPGQIVCPAAPRCGMFECGKDYYGNCVYYEYEPLLSWCRTPTCCGGNEFSERTMGMWLLGRDFETGRKYLPDCESIWDKQTLSLHRLDDALIYSDSE